MMMTAHNFTTKITTMLFMLVSVLSLASLVASAPFDLALRDVWDPEVLYPHFGTVWKIGNAHNVTWDTSNAPKQITNPIGIVVLAQGNTLLDLDNPLASNFSLMDGRVEVTVPHVAPGTYNIVLFGDSGNHGSNFTIEEP